MDKLLLAAKARLGSFGYELKDGDEALLSLAIERVENSVKNNLARDIPEELIGAASDMAVGEFLSVKNTFAPKDIAPLASSAAVSQIVLGDAKTSFAVRSEDTPEAKLERLISYLLNHGKGELSCYRKIRW